MGMEGWSIASGMYVRSKLGTHKNVYLLGFHLPSLSVPRPSPSFLSLQYEKLGGELRTGLLFTYSSFLSEKRLALAYAVQLMRPGIGRNVSCAVGDFT